jgi:outer membrane protein OmpA-like peptidoglycan-associated protein
MFKSIKSIAVILVLSFGALGVFAQPAKQTRTVASGEKIKLKGVVIAKSGETAVVRDANGIDTNVTIAPDASVKTNGVFGGNKVSNDNVVRGLNLEIEGTGDASGNLVAKKVRFNKSDMKVAQAIESRVSPAEDRLSQAEQNSERISGQIDELLAISNAARGGAKSAQDSADAAIAGVNATNQRISSIDDFTVQSTATVNFKVGSAVLSPEGQAQLDELAVAALALRGYSIEVTGFADASGDPKKNKTLSQKRATSVIEYLVEKHNIPLRRVGNSYGFGEGQAVADNTTREGREQNRRVEVKLLVSRGLNTNVEVKKADEQ